MMVAVSGLNTLIAVSFVEDIAANSIQEASYGAFVEATWYATDSLRVIGGLRGDYYDFDVSALNALSVAGHKVGQSVLPQNCPGLAGHG